VNPCSIHRLTLLIAATGLSLITGRTIAQPQDPSNLLPATQNQELWYRTPAKYWNSQALHLGNGFMGASFFGGVEQETIALTEQSIWSGAPAQARDAAPAQAHEGAPTQEDDGVNPNAKKQLTAIRQAVVDGDIALSDSLTAKYYLGDNKHFGSFTSIGDILISTPAKPYTSYRRSLDLSQSLGHVDYVIGGTHYSREYFCSYPARVLAIKLKADTRAALDVSIAMKIIQRQYTIRVSGNSYIVDGSVDQGVRKFRVEILVIPYGGKIANENDRLIVKKADSLVLLVNASTDYRLHYPDYQGPDPTRTADSIIHAAAALGYETLKQTHLADYSALYNRVKLQIDDDTALNELPTDIRWQRLRQGKPDLGLKELAFNLGRYLIISASRPGTLPANLQGKWNTFYRSPYQYPGDLLVLRTHKPC
jgi:alpha-L-fucosidase 2